MRPLTYFIYTESKYYHYILSGTDIWNSITIFASGTIQLPSYIIIAWPYTTPFRKIVQIQLTCHLSQVYKRFSWMITVAFWHLIFSTVYVVHSIIFNLSFTVFFYFISLCLDIKSSQDHWHWMKYLMRLHCHNFKRDIDSIVIHWWLW